jgi:hypothetical protein
MQVRNRAVGYVVVDKKEAARVAKSERDRNPTPLPDFLRNGLGRCRTVGDPDWFVATETSFDHQAARTMAGDVCAECPFRFDCLQWAVLTKATGVWGGELLFDGVIRPNLGR